MLLGYNNYNGNEQKKLIKHRKFKQQTLIFRKELKKQKKATESFQKTGKKKERGDSIIENIDRTVDLY